MKFPLISLLVALWALPATAEGMKVHYSQLHFKAFAGEGLTCREARHNLQMNFAQWRATITRDPRITGAKGFVRLSGTPNLDIRSFSPCAIVNGLSVQTALASATLVFAPGEAGKPHGARLAELPEFAAVADGLDCLEAEYQARVALYEQIQTANQLYEFGPNEALRCGCDRNSFPRVAECFARNRAYFADSRNE